MFQPGEALTAYNAETVLQAGLQAVAAGHKEISLASLSAFDSAAVATLLAWKRAAAERKAALVFHDVPPNLQSLVDLYGVRELLER